MKLQQFSRSKLIGNSLSLSINCEYLSLCASDNKIPTLLISFLQNLLKRICILIKTITNSNSNPFLLKTDETNLIMKDTIWCPLILAKRHYWWFVIDYTCFVKLLILDAAPYRIKYQLLVCGTYLWGYVPPIKF